MKISKALALARKDLGLKGVSGSKLDSLVLLSHTLSFSKEQIIFNPDFEMNDEQRHNFFALIKRRSEFEPVSHLVGKREFFGEDFFVTKDVLDPRPDSEALIELCFKIFPKDEEALRILEIGVGSGCLIITLLKNYPQSQAVGVDISEPALKICKKNSCSLGVDQRLNLIHSNLFDSISYQAKPQFNLIISNPPYISKSDIQDLQPEVRIYEPTIALDGGEDGLEFYRAIANQAAKFLAENGKIILEIGYAQKPKVVEIFFQNNFELIAEKLDLAGVERALCFIKNPVYPIEIRGGDPRKVGRDLCRVSLPRRDKGQKNENESF